ncbi:hypothetical protein K8I61_04280 [bacterium]|nr:hypothetical protein [bacterium]
MPLLHALIRAVFAAVVTALAGTGLALDQSPAAAPVLGIAEVNAGRLIALAMLLLYFAEVAFASWQTREPVDRAAVWLAPAWLAFPIALLARVNLFPDAPPGRIAVALALFGVLRFLTIILAAPRPARLAPPSVSAPPVIVLVARSGVPGGATTAALVYELFGAIVLGVFIFGRAPAHVATLPALALISPGLYVLMTAAAFRAGGSRVVGLFYPIFAPALLLFAIAAALGLTHETREYAPAAAAMLAVGHLAVAAIAIRYRRGTHYALPCLAVALGLAFVSAEIGARVAYDFRAAATLAPIDGWDIERRTALVASTPRATDVAAREAVTRVALLGIPSEGGRLAAERAARAHFGGDAVIHVIDARASGDDAFRALVYLRDVLGPRVGDIDAVAFDDDPLAPAAADRSAARFAKWSTLVDGIADDRTRTRRLILSAGTRSHVRLALAAIASRLALGDALGRLAFAFRERGPDSGEGASNGEAMGRAARIENLERHARGNGAAFFRIRAEDFADVDGDGGDEETVESDENAALKPEEASDALPPAGN